MRSCKHTCAGAEIAVDRTNGWQWADAVFLPDSPVVSPGQTRAVRPGVQYRTAI